MLPQDLQQLTRKRTALWRWTVLGLVVLAGCAAPGPGGRDRLDRGTAWRPVPYRPEMAVDPHHLKDPRNPVFGGRPPIDAEPKCPPRSTVKLGPPGQQALEKIIVGAVVMREWPGYEEHHIFPQQQGLRDRFERRGVLVHDWTILVPKDRHAFAHRQDGGYGPGGKWNWDWAEWWRVQDEDVSVDTIFIHALHMIQDHQLGRYGMPFQYGCGRAISQDLYDIVQPPRVIRR